MADILISYMIKASVYLLLLAMAYQLMFSRRIHAGFNRMFLLSLVPFVLLVPYLSAWAFANADTVQISVVQLPEFVIKAGNVYNEANIEASAALSGAGNWLWVFPAGSVVVLLLTMLQLGRLAYLWWKAGSMRLHGLRVVQAGKETAPYSFFGMLVVSPDTIHDPSFEAILQHEKAHSEKFHSVDLLVFELLKVLFWFHPAYYYLRRELRSMHEYQADAVALRYMDRRTYQKALLQFSYSLNVIPLSNPFNVSLLKRRMLMMNKKGDQPTHNRLKLLVLLLLMSGFVFVQSCQSKKTEEAVEVSEIIEPQEHVVHSDTIYNVVEELPVFPGGTEALMQFIAENIQYPELAKIKNIEGRVFVNFVIEADGKVSNAKILRGIGHGCDEEALRVISSMPDWQAGKQGGQAVRTSFNIPIRFALK